MRLSNGKNEDYTNASIRLIQKQILRLMKNIPVVELQKINRNDPDTREIREILQRNLSESDFLEYSLWAWIMMKIKQK